MPRITKSFKPVSEPSENTEGFSVDQLVGEKNLRVDSGNSKPESQTSNFEPQDQPSSFYRRSSNYTDRDVPTEEVSGVLDIMPEGHGFLRPRYIPSDKDVYISASQIRRFNLRPGDLVEGAARPPKETERYFGLLQVDKVNGKDAEELVSSEKGRVKRVKFEDLTAIYPNRHLKLETGKAPLSQRVIDLIAPIGFGQRGLIVSPPKAG